MEGKSNPKVEEIYEYMMPPFVQYKTKDKRKMAAKIIFELASAEFEIIGNLSLEQSLSLQEMMDLLWTEYDFAWCFK